MDDDNSHIYHTNKLELFMANDDKWTSDLRNTCYGQKEREKNVTLVQDYKAMYFSLFCLFFSFGRVAKDEN